MIHHLKIKPEFYQAVIEGRKPFEIRYNDRNFQVNDRVILEEYKGKEFYGACPDRDTCGRFLSKYDEDGEELECVFNREICEEYSKDIYTGRRCLTIIREIFDIGFLMDGYVAFTFEVLNTQELKLK